MRIADKLTQDQFRDIVVAAWAAGRRSEGIEPSEFVRELKERLLSAARAADEAG